MGSLRQASRGQAGGGAACLLMLGLGPGQGKHSSEAFPATCRISQPSLWWPDSWQPGWGSENCQAPSPGDQRDCPSVQPVLGAAAWSEGWAWGSFISAFSPAPTLLPHLGN